MKLRELFEAIQPTDAEMKAAHGNDQEWDSMDADDKEMHPLNAPMKGVAPTPFTVYTAIQSVLGRGNVTYDEDELAAGDGKIYVWNGSREGFFVPNDDDTGGSIEVQNMDSRDARQVAIGVHEAYHAYIHQRTNAQGQLSSQEKIVNNLAYKWIMRHLKGMAQHVALEAINASRVNYGHHHMPNPGPSDLRELFNPQDAYQIEWRHNQARFLTSDNREIRISFHDQNLSSTSLVEITFSARVNDPTHGKSGTMGITGGGDAARILNTVVQATADYLSQNSPEYIMFTADEPSRQKLYAHMVRRLSSQYHRVTPGEFQHLNNDELPAPTNTVFLLRAI